VTSADPPPAPGGPVGEVDPTRAAARHRLLRTEVLLVLALSVGASAVYAGLSLLRRLLASTPLAQSRATLNSSYVPDQPWLDLAFQLVGIATGVVPALLALHLLARDGLPAAAIGVDARHRRGDLSRGAVLAAAVGIPGLLLYLAAYQLPRRPSCRRRYRMCGGGSRSWCCPRRRTRPSRRSWSSATC
jgi:hypothetical protein